jgi:SulP family sulfate permease
VANLLISTFMAGILMFLMGALRLGNLIRFIPVSIVIGFTNGIAVIIALQQVKDFLGLEIDRMPANFFSQLSAIWQAIGTINPAAFGLGVVSLTVVVLWPKSYKPNDGRWRRWLARVPGTIVVLVLGTAVVALAGLPVETIGSRFGGIPQGLPRFELPPFEWESAQNLVMPTLSIALLGAIESLLCARVADGITGDRHDPNQELMAQGAANFVVPFFGGIAATGTVARTVTNIRCGARTPVSGVVHAGTLLLIVLALAPLASSIPLASLAAILLFVAWNMGDWREFARLRQFSVNYRTILLATFLLTVIFDVIVAVEIGLFLAALLFITRIASLTRIEEIPLPSHHARTGDGRRVAAFRVFGSLFFGSVTKLEQLLDPARPLAEVVVLELHQVINLDTTGLDALESLHRMLARRGGRLLLAAPNPQPLSLLRRSGFLARLGPDAVFGDMDEALRAAAAQTSPG